MADDKNRDPLPRCPVCLTELDLERIEGDVHDCGGALVSEPDWYALVCPECGFEREATI